MYNYKHLIYVIIIVLTSFVIPKLPISIMRILNSNFSRALLLLIIPLSIIVDPILGLLLTILFVSIVYELNKEKMKALNRTITDISNDVRYDVGRMNITSNIEFNKDVYPFVPSPEMGTNRVDLVTEPILWKTI